MGRIILAALLLLAPGVALAQPRPRSAARGEQRYEAGVEAYGRRQFHLAAIEFRAAYELTNEPALLFNLGSALAADGQRAAAREALERYLRATPDAVNRAAVEARLRELDPTPVASPPAALPAPIVPARVAAPDAPSRRSPLPLVGAVGGGVGLLAAGVGLGLYLDVDAQFTRCAQQRCPVDQQPRTEDTIAVAMLWGGGALALAGLVTFLAAPRSTRASTPRAWLLPTPRGLALGGVF